MQEVESKENFVWMKDFYAPLLTEKQQQILDLYLESDFTLTEIAEMLGTSRQAIYDMVKRSEKLLSGYEEKLGLLERFKEARRKTEAAKKLVADLSIDEQSRQTVFQLLNEILEEL